mmetsp:Transcript_99809/g.265270  ORF Transcript_99809/g.265270 Transcript_99809/m.265270 type:complete len:144 (-) Transcript_99809:117-548(-)
MATAGSLLACAALLCAFALPMVGASEVAASPGQRPRPGTRQHKEESLLRSLLNCPLCKGKEVVACFKDCRYNDGLGWRACLTRCLTDNSLILDTFLRMVPDDEDERAASKAAEAGGMLEPDVLLREAAAVRVQPASLGAHREL